MASTKMFQTKWPVRNNWSVLLPGGCHGVESLRGTWLSTLAALHLLTVAIHVPSWDVCDCAVDSTRQPQGETPHLPHCPLESRTFSLLGKSSLLFCGKIPHPQTICDVADLFLQNYSLCPEPVHLAGAAVSLLAALSLLIFQGVLFQAFIDPIHRNMPVRSPPLELGMLFWNTPILENHKHLSVPYLKQRLPPSQNEPSVW